MKVISAKYEIINKENIDGLELLKGIEVVGRTCYKSENNITDDSAKKFVAKLIENGHEAMIEHNAISVRFICDRGVSHELVRHRLASFGQESTRYCNYSKDKFGNELTVIEPVFWEYGTDNYNRWVLACKQAETSYFTLLNDGASPQEARSVLPNSLKTEIVMTMNLREWRHFFSLRADKPAHPQMRELAVPLLKEMSELIPIVFNDLVQKLLC
ncbi:FAD-dependent thymidylate synthase [Clostridium sp.]|uniref:FAD-dependent thymidylate synthase n=1 Tax=Clostridium sp. TaxID=1506 RepID=UPI002840776C|nr:FAD-dependent thymidylate synthase [Clostridium sp.]MDR3595128.1 FAD-dependent thymidylate synthase [Clostridium sp.]